MYTSRVLSHTFSGLEAIDPTQAYFWTKGWQKKEAEADKDKKARKIIGDGTAKGLIRELKS